MGKGDRGYWVAPRLPRLWEGSTVFILGGGPSLSQVDLKLLEGQRVIGVNDAYKLGPVVDAVIFNDAEWFKAHRQGLKGFGGMKFSTNGMTRKVDGINCLYPRLSGITLDEGCCALNKSSGGAAMNLAVILGAAQIVLLGFDMHAPDPKQPNWHNNNIAVGVKGALDPKTYEIYRNAIARDIVPAMKRLKVKVINATPGSELKCFEFGSLEDALKGAKAKAEAETTPAPVAHRAPAYEPMPGSPYVISKCVCGSTRFKDSKTTGFNGNAPATFTLATCRDCEVIHQRVFKHELAGLYENPYHDREWAQGYEKDVRVAEMRLEKYQIKDGARCLDVGSCNGAFVDACRKQGLEAWGVEPGADKHELKENHTYPGYLADSNFPSGHFDVVTAHDVLEHVPDISAFLKEIRRVTVDGGTVIFDVPDFFADAGRHHWRETEHIWYLNEKQFSDLFKAHGFRVSGVDRPIPGKLVFTLKSRVQKRTSIVVPPGVGDIYWVVVKLQAMAEREGFDGIDLVIQNSGKKHRRSEMYVQSIPFVRFAGYCKTGSRNPVFKTAYFTDTKSIFKKFMGHDYFIGFNGKLSPRKDQCRPCHSMNDIHPEYAVDWFHPQFESLRERSEIMRYREHYGNFVVAYFPDHSMYSKWVDDFSADKIAECMEHLIKELGCKVVLTGAHWDTANAVNARLREVEGVIDIVGETDLEQAFALLKASKGVIGFPSGLPIMAVKFKVPTLMLWHEFFRQGFWNNCVPDVAAGRWYEAVPTAQADPIDVAERFISLIDKKTAPADKPIVACLYRSGGDFCWADVERLARAVRKHTSVDYDFVCLTDVETDRALTGPKNIETAPLLHDWPGWWSKLELFRPGLFDDRPVLYLDLDTVIVKNIDHLLKDIGGLELIRDLGHPKKLATGLMSWQGDQSYIYERYLKELSQTGSDQTWLRTWLPDTMNGDTRYMQDRAKIYSYKKHARGRTLPADAEIVCFHGKPRPHECSEGAAWFVENWRSV